MDITNIAKKKRKKERKKELRKAKRRDVYFLSRAATGPGTALLLA